MAQTLHVPGKELAKTVMLKVGERFVMTVLPANWKVDLRRLRDIFQTHHVWRLGQPLVTGMLLQHGVSARGCAEV